MMKKITMVTVALLIIVVSYNVSFLCGTGLMSDLTLANVEALANDGESTNGYFKTSSSVESKEENDCYVVVTTTTTVRCNLGGFSDCTPGTNTSVDHYKKPNCPN